MEKLNNENFVLQRMQELLKAKDWSIYRLAKELGLGNPDGFVFNMSVGYDLEGIKSEKVNTCLLYTSDAADE